MTNLEDKFVDVISNLSILGSIGVVAGFSLSSIFGSWAVLAEMCSVSGSANDFL